MANREALPVATTSSRWCWPSRRSPADWLTHHASNGPTTAISVDPFDQTPRARPAPPTAWAGSGTGADARARRSAPGLAGGGHRSVAVGRFLDGQRELLVLRPVGQRVGLRPPPRTQLALRSSRVASHGDLLIHPASTRVGVAVEHLGAEGDVLGVVAPAQAVCSDADPSRAASRRGGAVRGGLAGIARRRTGYRTVRAPAGAQGFGTAG